MKYFCLAVCVFVSMAARAQCIPPNNLDIPASDVTATGIQKTAFNAILARVYNSYKDAVAARGGNLVINNLWSSGTVNASAYRSGNNWYINAYGGLARYPGMTAAAYGVIMCHEVGHHIGGFPLYPGSWASAEGQADYWATRNCLRSVGGAQTLARVIARLNGESVPKLNTPDKRRVGSTISGYPSAQCRLDTMYNAIRSMARPACWFRG